MAKKRSGYNWVISPQLRHKMRCIKALKALLRVYIRKGYSNSKEGYGYDSLKLFIANRKTLVALSEEEREFGWLLVKIGRNIEKVEVTSNGVMLNDTYLVRSNLARYLKAFSFKISSFLSNSSYQEIRAFFDEIRKYEGPTRYFRARGPYALKYKNELPEGF